MLRTLGKGAWPDGIAFDSYGNLWGTLVYSDKLFVLTPQGDLRFLLDEGDPAHVATIEDLDHLADPLVQVADCRVVPMTRAADDRRGQSRLVDLAHRPQPPRVGIGLFERDRRDDGVDSRSGSRCQ